MIFYLLVSALVQAVLINAQCDPTKGKAFMPPQRSVN